MTPKKKLSEIVKDMAGLKERWANTKPAPDLKPVPTGQYVCSLDDIRPDASKGGTPRLKIAVTVTEGECASRRVWHDAYLTPAALPYTLRLLAKIGLTDLEKIDDGVPAGIVVRAHVVLKTRDDKSEYNEIRDWELLALPPDGPSGAPARPDAPTPPPAPAPWSVDLGTLDGDEPKGEGQ